MSDTTADGRLESDLLESLDMAGFNTTGGDVDMLLAALASRELVVRAVRETTEGDEREALAELLWDDLRDLWAGQHLGDSWSDATPDLKHAHYDTLDRLLAAGWRRDDVDAYGPPETQYVVRWHHLATGDLMEDLIDDREDAALLARNMHVPLFARKIRVTEPALVSGEGHGTSEGHGSVAS